MKRALSPGNHTVPTVADDKKPQNDPSKPLLSIKTDELIVVLTSPNSTSFSTQKRMQLSPVPGTLILKKKGSVSFFIDLLSPGPSKAKASPANISFPKIAKHQIRDSPQKLNADLQSKMQKIEQRRQFLIAQRRNKLRSQIESAKLRSLIQKSKERLQMMRLQAKLEYKMSSASLKRSLLQRKNQERWAAAVEKANSIALMNKMKKFLDLRKAVSDSIVDVLNFDQIHGSEYAAELASAQELLRGLNVEIDSDSDSDELETAVQQPSATTDSTVYQQENNTSPIKESSLTPINVLLGTKDRSPEQPGIIKRSNSVPTKLLDDPSELLVLELVYLLPSVNRFTLRELDLDEILSNAQLRHDLVFDPDLKFKPTTEQDETAQEKIDSYWNDFSQEISLGTFYRIPILLAEVRSILVELLPHGTDMKEELFANIDAKLVAQQIEHGIMNPIPLIEYTAKLIKTNCAPIRDVLVDKMVQVCKEGKITETFKYLFEILELMKLDYANHQISKLLPHMLEHAVDFEWKWFKVQFDGGVFTLSATREWLKSAVIREKDGKNIKLEGATCELYTDALLNLITKAARFSDLFLPETLRMDKSRLISYYNDLQDITIQGSILVVFRSAAGPNCTAEDLEKAKSDLWVLLNDSDSTMNHIALQMGHLAGKIRKRPFSTLEYESLENLVDKTLAPESKVFELVQKRTLYNLAYYMTYSKVDSAMLSKHGLSQVEKEVTELGKKICKVSQLNRAIFSKLYQYLLIDIKEELKGKPVKSHSEIIKQAS